MDETKKILYLKNEIEEKGLDFIKESFKNPNLKEIYFLGIYNHKKLGDLKEGCKILNEILLENKKIEKIFLRSKL
jgi:hypothetical protein